MPGLEGRVRGSPEGRCKRGAIYSSSFAAQGITLARPRLFLTARITILAKQPAACGAPLCMAQGVCARQRNEPGPVRLDQVRHRECRCGLS